MRNGKWAIVCAAAAVGLGVTAGTARAQSRTWTNNLGGNWNNPSNWNPNGVPDTASEGAILNLGSNPDITVDGNYSIGTLDWVSGNLLSFPPGNSISVSGSAWVGQHLPGPPGPNNLSLSNSTLNLSGNTTQGALFQVFLDSSGSTINNSGVYTLQNGSAIFSGSFNNSGTLQNDGMSGFEFVDGVVNTGTIKSQAPFGSLSIVLADGGTSSGTFQADTGATLMLSGGAAHTIDSSATFSGDGTFEFYYGDITVEASPTFTGPVVVSGGVTFNANVTASQSLTLSGGIMDGTGNLSINDFYWTGGTMNGPGTNTVSGSSNLDTASGNLVVDARTLAFASSASTTVMGNNSVSLENGATLENSGVYEIMEDSNILASPSSTVHNLANAYIKKTGGLGTSTIQNVINDDGYIGSQSGTLDVHLVDNQTSTGNFYADSNTTLRLTSNNHTFSYSGFGGLGNPIPGTIEFAGSGNTVVGNQVIDANVVIQGDITFDQTKTINHDLAIAGTLNGNNIQSKTLHWTSGVMASTGGNTTITDGATLSGSAFLQLDNTTLNLQGNTLQSSDNGVGLALAISAVLNNSGAYDIASDSNITADSNSAINNTATGTLTKNGGTGISTVENMNNSGTVRVNTGTLNLYNYTQLGGVTDLNGGNIQASTFLSIVGGTLQGDGVVDGNVQLNATLSPGHSPGLMTITGNLIQTSNSTLLMELGGTGTRGTDYDALDIGGALSANGTLQIDLLYTPAVGDTFDLLDFNSFSGDFASYDLPDLQQLGLDWDTSAISSTGILSVVAVPEPGTLTLLGIGAAALLMRRRRRA